MIQMSNTWLEYARGKFRHLWAYFIRHVWIIDVDAFVKSWAYLVANQFSVV